MTTDRRDDWFCCPNCGAEVPMTASVCPECGSDDEAGWSEDAEYAGLDLPDDEDEFTPEPAATLSPFWQTIAIVVLIAIGLLILGGLW